MMNTTKRYFLRWKRWLVAMLAGCLWAGCSQETVESQAVDKQPVQEKTVVERSLLEDTEEDTEQIDDSEVLTVTEAFDIPEVKPNDKTVRKPLIEQGRPNAEQDTATLLKQEVQQLKIRLEKDCKELQINGIDRRQGMGQRVDELINHRSIGNRAMDDGDYLAARTAYRQAETMIAWLKENLPLRETVAGKLDKMLLRERDLVKLDIKRYALVSFTLTGNLLREAQRAFDDGQFEAASKRLDACQEGFDNAVAEMLHERMEAMKKEARIAANRGTRDGWETVLQLSEEMAAVDEAVGKEWRERAQKHLNEQSASGETVPETVAETDVQDVQKVAVMTVLNEAERAVKPDDSQRNVGDVHETKTEVAVEAKTAAVVNEFNGIVLLPGGCELRLNKIKAGTFLMGSAKNEKSHERNEATHQVTLTKDYWIGETEVTQAQWRAVGVKKAKDCHWKGDNLPVEYVSWQEAIDFCRKLTELMAGKLPSGYHFSLPTEAQWEYACRGGKGTRTPFHFGDMLNGTQANCNGTCPYGTMEMGKAWGRTVPVKQYPPNAYGLYDMHGNVWEWCLDHSDFDYELYTDTYIGKTTDPLCSIGSFRMRRGGSWNNFAVHCRTASRNSREVNCRDDETGFRIVLTTMMK